MGFMDELKKLARPYAEDDEDDYDDYDNDDFEDEEDEAPKLRAPCPPLCPGLQCTRIPQRSGVPPRRQDRQCAYHGPAAGRSGQAGAV